MRTIALKQRDDGTWLMSGPGFEAHTHPSKEIAIDHAKKTARQQGHDQIVIYDELMNELDRITQHEFGGFR